MFSSFLTACYSHQQSFDFVLDNYIYRDRQADRQTDRQRQRDRDRQRQRETQRETERQRQKETETEKQTDRETETDRDRETETERHRDREACGGDLQKVREALLVSGGTSSVCRELPVHVQSVKVVAVQILHSVVGEGVHVGRAGHHRSADTDVVNETRAAYRHSEVEL